MGAASQQLDVVTVSATSSLTAGDVIKVDIDCFDFEATFGAGQSTVTLYKRWPYKKQWS